MPEEDDNMKMENGSLTSRQEAFCLEYMVDYNGTQAAIRAKYSERSASAIATRLLKNVSVLARVKELQAEKTARLCITADWVIQELVEVVKKSLQDDEIWEWDYKEKKKVPTGKYVYDSKGATKALELLGKHLGMFDKKVDSDSEEIGGVVILPEILYDEPQEIKIAEM